MNIEDLSWHDGILNGYSFNPNYDELSKITLDLELYPEQVHSKERKKLKVICENISSVKSNIDINVLKKNKNFGNINHGELTGSVLRIELFGGELVIEAKKFNVEC